MRLAMGEAGLLGNYDPYADGFTRAVVQEFARVGVYPPPYCGGTDPESVLFLLAAQERWKNPPSLLGTDEEGVMDQMSEFLASVGLGLKRYDALRDPGEFGSWHHQ
jgi:hypothetical protein